MDYFKNMGNLNVVETSSLFQEKRVQDQKEKFKFFYQTFIDAVLQLEIYQEILEDRNKEEILDGDLSDEEDQYIQNQVLTKVDRIYFYFMTSVEELVSQEGNLFEDNFGAVLKKLEEKMTRDDQVSPYCEFTLRTIQEKHAENEQKKLNQREVGKNIRTIKK